MLRPRDPCTQHPLPKRQAGPLQGRRNCAPSCLLSTPGALQGWASLRNSRDEKMYSGSWVQISQLTGWVMKLFTYNVQQIGTAVRSDGLIKVLGTCP